MESKYEQMADEVKIQNRTYGDTLLLLLHGKYKYL